MSSIQEALKRAQSSHQDAQKSRAAAAALRAGIAAVTDDVKLLFVSAANANESAAACSRMVEKMSIAGSLAAKWKTPPPPHSLLCHSLAVNCF